eukprot:6488782-Amphidinium_carterae.1
MEVNTERGGVAVAGETRQLSLTIVDDLSQMPNLCVPGENEIDLGPWVHSAVSLLSPSQCPPEQKSFAVIVSECGLQCDECEAIEMLVQDHNISLLLGPAGQSQSATCPDATELSTLQCPLVDRSSRQR